MEGGGTVDELEAISSLQRVSGWQATRRYLIRHLRVASGIRERHAQQLEALDANHKVPGHENLVVACADKQVTVWCNTEHGTRLRCAMYWGCTKEEGGDGGVLTALTWMAGDLYQQPDSGFRDSILAVASSRGHIYIMSRALSRVTACLCGVEGPVIQMDAASENAAVLVSLTAAGHVQVWDAQTETCMASFDADAISLAVLPNGLQMLTGDAAGCLHLWELPQSALEHGDLPQCQVLQWEQWPHRCALDSLRILQQGLRLVLASKSEDGLLATWDLQCGQILHRWQARADMVPGGNKGARCSMGHTADGHFLACGNCKGHVYVYDALQGCLLTHLRPRRFEVPVRGCALAEDGSSLLATSGKGYMLRYKASPRKPRRDKWDHPSASEDSDEDCMPSAAQAVDGMDTRQARDSSASSSDQAPMDS